MDAEAREVIESAIQMEKDGIRFYTETAEMVDNPVGKRLFLSLVEDEKKHLEKLEEASRGMGFKAGEQDKKPFPEKVRSIFSDIPGEVRESIDIDARETEALRTAIRMEEEGIRHYSRKLAGMGGEAAELAEFIVKEEKSHRDILENTLTYLTDHNSWAVETEGWNFEG